MSKYDKITPTEKIKTILEHFGIANQIEKTIEELDELKEQLEIILAKYNKQLINMEQLNNLVSELADVIITTEQVITHFGIGDSVENAIDYKLNRTLERMESGYYKDNQKNCLS